MEEHKDATTNVTKKLEGYTCPVDPEKTSIDDHDDDDFARAATTAKAYVGQALAVIAKMHGDMTHPDGVQPGWDEADAALAEGSRAVAMACRYIDLLVTYRDDGHDAQPKAVVS